jgi:hypothetical protein
MAGDNNSPKEGQQTNEHWSSLHEFESLISSNNSIRERKICLQMFSFKRTMLSMLDHMKLLQVIF